LPTKPIAGLAAADRPFEYIPHAELAPNPLHIDRATFVREAGVAGDDEQ
jgi:hypothetical protein